MLGRDAESRNAGIRRLGEGSPPFRQGDLGHTGKRDVDIVFEHPGEATFPVSCLVVKRGGMVVFCAGTSGFNITFDARYVWMRQKRVQGSHFAHLKQASAANRFVIDRRIDPCMSDVFPWAKIPHAHELMRTNRHKPGNMAVLVNAPRTGLRNLDDVVEAASMPQANREFTRVSTGAAVGLFAGRAGLLRRKPATGLDPVPRNDGMRGFNTRAGRAQASFLRHHRA